jgi:tetratricopeptide (TPR) repeat protein
MGVIVIGVFVSLMAIINSTPRSIVWERDYERAVQRARAENKIILADMFTDWCVLCKDMDRVTFDDRAVISQMGKKYVWLKLNTETEEDGIKLYNDFAISTYPTILVLDSNGEEIDRIERFLTPLPFKQTVEAHLQNPESLGKVREEVEKTPESVELRSTLGNKYLDRKNYRKAVVEFQHILDLDPENLKGKTVEASYNLALSFASQTKFDEALAQLASLERKFPNAKELPDVYVLRGQVFECCGKKEMAVSVFREYLEKYPNHDHVDRVKEMMALLEGSTEIP